MNRTQHRVIRCFQRVSFATLLTGGAALGQSKPAPMADARQRMQVLSPAPPAPSVSASQSSPPPAVPSPAPQDADSGDRARAEYEAGKVLFDNGDYTGALVKLQRAYELSHKLPFLWNMIVCEKQLRHYSRMRALLQRYLTEGGSQLSQDDVEQCRRLLDSIQPYVGELALEVDQPGATVWLDGQNVGTTPLSKAVLVDLGTRELRITKLKYQDWAKTFQVEGAKAIQIQAKLQRVADTARLMISGPKDSAISVDRREVGQGRWEGTVLAGTHEVLVTGAQAKPYNAELVLRPLETRRLVVSLEPEKKNHLWWWVAGGVVLASGLAAGAYAIFAPASTPAEPGAPVGSFGSAVLPCRP